MFIQDFQALNKIFISHFTEVPNSSVVLRLVPSLKCSTVYLTFFGVLLDDDSQ